MSAPTYSATDGYVNLVTSHQVHLQGYIFASLANHADAEDVLQRTNLTLLKKADSFPSGGEFLPWALAVAKYEILSFVRDNRRERIVFTSSVVELMCETAGSDVADISDRQEALRNCLQKIPDRSRQMLVMRYAANRPLQQIASLTGRSIDGVKAALFRLRRKLENCVEHRVSSESTLKG